MRAFMSLATFARARLFSGRADSGGSASADGGAGGRGFGLENVVAIKFVSFMLELCGVLSVHQELKS